MGKGPQRRAKAKQTKAKLPSPKTVEHLEGTKIGNKSGLTENDDSNESKEKENEHDIMQGDALKQGNEIAQGETHNAFEQVSKEAVDLNDLDLEAEEELSEQESGAKPAPTAHTNDSATDKSTTEMSKAGAPNHAFKGTDTTPFAMSEALAECQRKDEALVLLQNELDAVRTELKSTQITLQESHQAFAEQMVELSSSHDRDKEDACKILQDELEQARADLHTKNELVQKLKTQLHEKEVKAEAQATRSQEFEAMRDLQVRLSVRLFYSSQELVSRARPSDSLASFAEAFGYSQNADYVRIPYSSRLSWKRYDHITLTRSCMPRTMPSTLSLLRPCSIRTKLLWKSFRKCLRKWKKLSQARHRKSLTLCCDLCEHGKRTKYIDGLRWAR